MKGVFRLGEASLQERHQIAMGAAGILGSGSWSFKLTPSVSANAFRNLLRRIFKTIWISLEFSWVK